MRAGAGIGVEDWGLGLGVRGEVGVGVWGKEGGAVRAFRHSRSDGERPTPRRRWPPGGTSLALIRAVGVCSGQAVEINGDGSAPRIRELAKRVHVYIHLYMRTDICTCTSEAGGSPEGIGAAHQRNQRTTASDMYMCLCMCQLRLGLGWGVALGLGAGARVWV